MQWNALRNHGLCNDKLSTDPASQDRKVVGQEAWIWGRGDTKSMYRQDVHQHEAHFAVKTIQLLLCRLYCQEI